MKTPRRDWLGGSVALALASGCMVGQTTETPTAGPPPVVVAPRNDHGDRGPLVLVAPAPPVSIRNPPVAGPPRSSQPPFIGPAISAASAPPPLSGGTLLVLADGRTAVASDPDRDRIWVVDVVAEVVKAEIPLQPGDEPGRLVQDGAHRVHVALRRGGAVVSFTPGQPEVAVERRPVCSAPRGLAYQANAQQIHVACAGGELVSLPAGGGPPTRTVRLDDDLRDVVVDRRDGRLLVSRFRSAEVLQVGADGRIEQRLRPPEELNLSRRSTVARPARTKFLPSVAWRTIARPDGGVYIAHQRAFTGELATSPSGGGYNGAVCDGIVQSVVTALDPAVDAVASPEPAPSLASVVLPVDLAVSPDGARLALLAAGEPGFMGDTSQVVTGPTVAFSPRPEQTGCNHMTPPSPPPLPPNGPTSTPPVVVEDQWGAELTPSSLAASRIGGQGVAVAFDARGEVLVQTRAPATVRVPRLGKVIPLGPAQERDTGYTVFHAATAGGVACASCHPTATEDGHVWNFVDLGPRRTQFLRVGLGGTAPFHWDGSFATLDNLMDDVFSGRMAGPVLQKEHVAALASWLDRLPALPPRRSVTDAAAQRGRAVFESPSVGCAQCHKGPALTDNLGHDVGRGVPLQTPSLLGVSWHLPLMHDGCATTLEARFRTDCGGDDRHGVVSRLSPAEQADLVAFLESL